jgi:Xaa-Pro aminopeptidase
LLVWQRSASTYDKVGDVYWLTNFQTYGTGQDPVSETIGEPYTFSAVLIRKGREPELHIGLTEDDIDVPKLCYGKLVVHEPHMIVKLAEYLRAEKIEGRVAVVGDDILPGMFDRMLRKHTPQIEWVSEEQMLVGPQLIKSPRELEAYRVAGALVSEALQVATEAMIAGERQCEAAARAAAIIMRGGGGFHRISIAHGPQLQNSLNKDYYGYNMTAPNAGDIVTVWIYGPIFAGYWLDPGRSGICGKRPTPAQKALVENCAGYVDEMVKAVKPGMTPAQLGIRWAEIARKGKYFVNPVTDAEHVAVGYDHGFGHGLGTCFPGYVLPVGDAEIGPFGYKRLKETLAPGMTLAAEAFMTRPNVGTIGFERNFVVTDSGAEVLDKTPMLFW